MPVTSRNSFTVLELCAGGGGQTIGLEEAGFACVGAVEIEPIACQTLKLNRPALPVFETNLRSFSGRPFRGVDVVSAGVPCPPFSIAGKQLGENDDRDLFPEALRVIQEARPRAVMLENVPGLASAKFTSYRDALIHSLRALGFEVGWNVLQASNYGVPQLRPRFIMVGIKREFADFFHWPTQQIQPRTVGYTLHDLMASGGWQGAEAWALRANKIAPTIVGGSKKHGGPDLGPTRAKAQWRALGVDGMGIADAAPGPDFPNEGFPKLTAQMVARLQGFPDHWVFAGRKTTAYRQVGNAFPPPVAQAVASAIRNALNRVTTYGENCVGELFNTSLTAELPTSRLIAAAV